MYQTGKKSLGSLDGEIQALRSRIVLSSHRPAASTATSGSTQALLTNSNATQSQSSSGGGAASILYGGLFEAPSKAKQQRMFADPNSSELAEALHYLKKAKRSIVADFEEMDEQFEYDEEAEALKHDRAMITAAFASKIGGDVNRGEQSELVLRYAQPVEEPFRFALVPVVDEPCVQRPPAVDDRSDHLSGTSERRQSKAQGPNSSAGARTPTVASSSGHFESLYDVSSALDAKPRSHSSSSGVTSGRLATQLSVRRGEGSVATSSQKGSVVAGAGGKPKGLSTTGTVVAVSGVDVRSHIQQGLARVEAQSRTVMGKDGVVGMDEYGRPMRLKLVRHRPDCTVRVVNDGAIRFCPSCGACVTVATCVGGLCPKCGASVERLALAATHAGEATSADDRERQDAIQAIEEMERREALEFQIALKEWRNAGGKENEVEGTEVQACDATASTATKTSGLEKLLGAHTAVRNDKGNVLVNMQLPRGSTYFSSLWEQMQRLQ